MIPVRPNSGYRHSWARVSLVLLQSGPIAGAIRKRSGLPAGGDRADVIPLVVATREAPAHVAPFSRARVSLRFLPIAIVVVAAARGHMWRMIGCLTGEHPVILVAAIGPLAVGAGRQLAVAIHVAQVGPGFAPPRPRSAWASSGRIRPSLDHVGVHVGRPVGIGRHIRLDILARFSVILDHVQAARLSFPLRNHRRWHRGARRSRRLCRGLRYPAPRLPLVSTQVPMRSRLQPATGDGSDGKELEGPEHVPSVEGMVERRQQAGGERPAAGGYQAGL